MTLLHIMAATLLAGAASVLAAAVLSLTVLSGVVHRLVSLSAGLLLGMAVLHLLPEAIESGADLHALSATLLAGLVGFFLLEKLAIFRHSHHYEGDGHGHSHGHDSDEAGPQGMLILVGDGIHNFADGIIIAAAFLADIRLGWMTAFAAAAHEIPQEIGDFIVLRNAGYSRARALVYNLLSGLAAVLGGLVGYLMLGQRDAILPYVLMFAAASFVYIALADLVPDLHRQSRAHRNESGLQLTLMLVGIALVALITGGMHAH
ncbi:MAG: ZIP family metal transporter [Burkholderiaceae bacterium]|nr:ZIP family metal transporter [Burkholderiaceae bacterium]